MEPVRNTRQTLTRFAFGLILFLPSFLHVQVLGLLELTDLVKLASEGDKEEGQLKHHRNDQRDEKKVVIVRNWRTHLD